MGILDILRGNKAAKEVQEEKASPVYVNKDELIRFVNDEFKRREEERRPFEVQWKLNINFLEGQQYCEINPVTMSIEDIPPLYWWQEREVFNQIAPNIETRLARLSRMRPIFKVLPGSNSPEDIRATKVSTQILKTLYYDTQFKYKQGLINSWLEATGTCIVKSIWNPSKGRVVGVIDGIDENGQRTTQEIKEGDLEVVVCPPQEIYPDSSYHQTIKECKSIIHAKAYHVDDVEETWGIKVEPEELSVMQLKKSMTGIGGLGYGLNGGYNFASSKLKDHVLVKEYWERPSKKYPNGRLIIVTSNKLLFFGDLPYKIDENGELGLPFAKVCSIERPGVFWGKSIIERLIPLQRRYNALRNRKAEYLNRCSIGVWAVEDGAVDLDEFEENAGAPGSIITYRRGSSPPRMLDNPTLPSAFETELGALLQEFSIMSGVSELSRQSNAPSGVKSGVALSIALEQDDTRLSSTVHNIENFLVEVGKQWLRLYKQYVKGARTLRIIGKNNIVELIDWMQSDIRSEDVIIEPYSAAAESPAQRRQMVFDLLSTGLLIDPDTGKIDKNMRNKILEMMEFGNWEAADDDDELHIAKAERENLALKEGGLVMPASFDNHLLHLQKHNMYRVTIEYEQLAARNPEVMQAFESHINAHFEFIMQTFNPNFSLREHNTQRKGDNPQGPPKEVF